MFHDAAYFETLGKVWLLNAVLPEFADSLRVEQGTHVNWPIQAGIEPQ